MGYNYSREVVPDVRKPIMSSSYQFELNSKLRLSAPLQ